MQCMDLLELTPKKSNLYYTRGITPKHVTSGRAHLRGEVSGQQLRRNVPAKANF